MVDRGTKVSRQSLLKYFRGSGEALAMALAGRKEDVSDGELSDNEDGTTGINLQTENLPGKLTHSGYQMFASRGFLPAAPVEEEDDAMDTFDHELADLQTAIAESKDPNISLVKAAKLNLEKKEDEPEPNYMGLFYGCASADSGKPMREGTGAVYDEQKGGYKLIIKGLDEGCNKHAAQEAFAKFGTVKDFFQMPHRPFLAFVTFGTQEEAKTAGDSMNCTMLDGSRIFCDWARLRTVTEAPAGADCGKPMQGGTPVYDEQKGGYKLLVKGLKDGCNKETAEAAFAKFGTVKDFFHMTKEPFLAFVTFGTEDEAKTAGNSMNCTNLEGYRIFCNWAKPREPRPAGGNDCFKCHQPGHRASDCTQNGSDPPPTSSSARAEMAWGDQPTTDTPKPDTSAGGGGWGDEPAAQPASAATWGVTTGTTNVKPAYGGGSKGGKPMRDGIAVFDEQKGGYKLVVKGLKEGCSKEVAEAAFAKFGTVKDFYHMTKEPFMAFVTLGSEEEAKLAGDSLNCTNIEGSRIFCDWAKPRAAPTGGGGPRNNNCFKCQQPGHRSNECPGESSTASLVPAQDAGADPWVTLSVAPAVAPDCGGWDTPSEPAINAPKPEASIAVVGWGDETSSQPATASAFDDSTGRTMAKPAYGGGARGGKPMRDGTAVFDEQKGGYKLLVKGLKEGCNKDTAEAAFSKFGTVKDFYHMTRDPFLAFVTFGSQEEAKIAGDSLNCTNLEGFRIFCDWAKPRAAPTGGRGNNNCFKCNQPGHRSNECPGETSTDSTDTGAWGAASVAAVSTLSDGGGWGTPASADIGAAVPTGTGGWDDQTATESATSSGWGVEASVSTVQVPTFATPRGGGKPMREGGTPVYDEQKGGYKLLVKGLKDGCNKEAVEATFAKFGPLKDFYHMTKEPFLAFVTFGTEEEAKTAGNSLNCTNFEGSRIYCDWAKPRTGPRTNNCFKCQQSGHRANDCPGVPTETTAPSQDGWGTASTTADAWGAPLQAKVDEPVEVSGWGNPPVAVTSSDPTAVAGMVSPDISSTWNEQAINARLQFLAFNDTPAAAAGKGLADSTFSAAMETISAQNPTVDGNAWTTSTDSTPAANVGWGDIETVASGWGEYQSASTLMPPPPARGPDGFKQGGGKPMRDGNGPVFDEQKGGYKLMVKGLKEGCSTAEAAFGKFGALKDFYLMTREPFLAFVTFANQEEAKTAGDSLNCTIFEGSRIVCDWAKAREARQSGGNNCFKCHQPGHRANDCPGASTTTSADAGADPWGTTSTAPAESSAGGGWDTAEPAKSEAPSVGGWGVDSSTPVAAASAWSENTSTTTTKPAHGGGGKGGKPMRDGVAVFDEQKGGYKLVVKGLKEGCSKEVAEAAFAKFGTVKDFYHMTKEPFMAFVTLGSEEEAKLAGDSLNCTNIEGSRIYCDWAKPRAAPAGGGGPRNNNCFKCQQPGHRSSECPGGSSTALAQDTGSDPWGTPTAVSTAPTDNGGGWDTPVADVAAPVENSGGWDVETSTEPTAAAAWAPAGNNVEPYRVPGGTRAGKPMRDGSGAVYDEQKGGYKLMIRGLKEGCDKQAAEDSFAKFGTVKDFFHMGKEPFLAFVTFGTQEEAKAAGDSLNCTHFEGSLIFCDWAKPRAPPAGGGGPRNNNCFKCNQPGHRSNECPGGSTTAPAQDLGADPWGIPAAAASSDTGGGGWDTPITAIDNSAAVEGGGWDSEPTAEPAATWAPSGANVESTRGARGGKPMREGTAVYDEQKGGYKLLIKGLKQGCNKQAAEDAFAKFGTVKDFFHMGKEPFLAFVTFGSQEEAKTAGDSLNCTSLDGSRIFCDWAKPRTGTSSSRQSGSSSFVSAKVTQASDGWDTPVGTSTTNNENASSDWDTTKTNNVDVWEPPTSSTPEDPCEMTREEFQAYAAKKKKEDMDKLEQERLEFQKHVANERAKMQKRMEQEELRAARGPRVLPAPKSGRKSETVYSQLFANLRTPLSNTPRSGFSLTRSKGELRRQMEEENDRIIAVGVLPESDPTVSSTKRRKVTSDVFTSPTSEDKPKKRTSKPKTVSPISVTNPLKRAAVEVIPADDAATSSRYGLRSAQKRQKTETADEQPLDKEGRPVFNLLSMLFKP